MWNVKVPIMKKICVFLFFLFLVFQLPAQKAGKPEVKKERKFAGTALYGFMNGGSDLYLEYGFQNLSVLDVIYKGEEYTVEIYEMDTPENAFGIYSLHCFKCLEADTAGRYYCLSDYQLQFVKGKYYFSAVFPSGTEQAKKGAGEVASFFLKGKKEAVVEIPEEIRALPLPYSAKVKYLHGELSLANALPVLWDCFKGMEGYRIWLVKASRKEPFQALVIFSEPEMADRFTAVNRDKKISGTSLLQVERRSGNTVWLRENSL